MKGPAHPSKLLIPWPDLKPWHKFVLLILAGIIVLLVAVISPYNIHPDEFFHVEAFNYFENHWWPPEPDSVRLHYTPYGNSRVYSGEIVYTILAKPGAIINAVLQRITGHREFSYLTYRLFNVFLFIITLALLFFFRSRTIQPAIVGFLVLVIPQIYYIYSYANTDAFGITISVFLFLIVLRGIEKPLKDWDWKYILLLAFASGMIFQSKKPFLISLPFPLGLIGWKLFREWKTISRTSLFIGFATLCLLTAIISIPNIRVIGFLDRDYKQALNETKEKHAWPEYKSSSPTYHEYHLASKGYTYGDVLLEKPWLELSAKSFYGMFGHLDLENPPWIYLAALVYSLAFLSITTISLINSWSTISEYARLAVLLSPLVLLMNIAASLWQSLNIDFQPQGRYLFPALIPIAMLLMGTIYEENGIKKEIRTAIYLVMYLLCLYSLIFVLFPYI
jgi:4-amino-4-deoxy-L-arabinose transferase-like glycosyltransferase